MKLWLGEVDYLVVTLLGGTFVSMTKPRWTYINSVYLIYSFWGTVTKLWTIVGWV
jgi:hypothetical protein